MPVSKRKLDELARRMSNLGIAEEDIGKLRDFVRLMQSLARVGAI